jgi:hypothetical protein
VDNGYLALFDAHIKDATAARNDWRNSVNSQKGIGCFASIAELLDPPFRLADRTACPHRVIQAKPDGNETCCELSPDANRSPCRSQLQNAGEAPKLLRQIANGSYRYEVVSPIAEDLQKLLSGPERIPIWPLIVALYSGSPSLSSGRRVVTMDSFFTQLGVDGNLATVFDFSQANAANRRIVRMTEPYLLACAWKRLWDDGFRLRFPDLINFYLSLKPRGFVILSGISGNGKSQLPRRFADLIRVPESARASNFEAIPVAPNWTDMTPLFGFYNSLRGGFEPGRAITAFRKAIHSGDDHGATAVFLQLDELNLSRIEHYLSDYLSVMESRRREGETLVTDPIAIAGGRTGSIPFVGAVEPYQDFVNRVPAEISWPDNLLVIGTVNVDESTQGLSPKVLDRSNTIEVGLPPMLEPAPEGPAGYKDADLHLLGHYLADRAYRTFEEAKTGRPDEVGVLTSWLHFNVNMLLEKWRADFGARIYEEAAMYLAHAADFIDQAEAAGIDLQGFSLPMAVDFQIMQKVLPRLSGTQEELKYAAAGDLFAELGKVLDASDLKKSAGKLKRMESQEIVSFWEA